MSELSQEEKLKIKYFLKTLENKDQMRDWFRLYLNLEIVSDTIDPDSTSNPLDAMWSIYEAVRDNKGEDIAGFIMLSAREAYKTLSAAMLEVILLLHFQVSISHMAAIQKQSDRAVAYITGFLNKLKKYIDGNGWAKVSESKTQIEFQTPEGHRPYILVVICSMAGANGPHTNLMFIDEIDVVRDPNAYEEAKLIPGMERGRYPITVKLSTRKFAFGMMEKELNQVATTGEIVKRWNILDIAEKCQPARYQPNSDGTRIDVYTHKRLPLRSISTEEYSQIQPQEKDDYELVKAHPGCLGCKLLPVCKTRLADKPETSVKNLYKPIPAVIRAFKQVSPDMAEAQLMCWRPSTKGLVYPRFDAMQNLVTMDRAVELLTGDRATGTTLDQFVALLHKLEAKVYAGVDWGYTHEATIVVLAVTPSGYSFILDTFGSPGLEVHDFKEIAVKYQERFGIMKWFCDQASPANIKTFIKAGLKCPDFTKDILGGIEAIRSQVTDTMGNKKLLVLATENNQKIVMGFKVHHFKLDAAGNVTKAPDDEEYADVMDALRYIGQNIFGPRSANKVLIASDSMDSKKPIANHAEQLKQEITSRVQEASETTDKTAKGKKGFFWDV